MKINENIVYTDEKFSHGKTYFPGSYIYIYVYIK